ncbi:MAG: hypothetical protein KGH77_03215 [Candidatus Micrarchaeota archaeon]|nr:hypothetical protein [Candidatus Micrarchaeota archaeon]MDE1864410.1 hypothetical protein [Candidatus Micrarchaeota archaeon]
MGKLNIAVIYGTVQRAVINKDKMEFEKAKKIILSDGNEIIKLMKREKGVPYPFLPILETAFPYCKCHTFQSLP